MQPHLKPQTKWLMDCDFYKAYNANIHRGVHTMSQEATDKFDKHGKI